MVLGQGQYLQSIRLGPNGQSNEEAEWFEVGHGCKHGWDWPFRIQVGAHRSAGPADSASEIVNRTRVGISSVPVYAVMRRQFSTRP